MAGGGVDRVDDAVARGIIEEAVDRDRCGQAGAATFNILIPGEAEPADIMVVDVFQRAVMIFIDAAIAGPVGAVAPGLA